MVFLFGVGLTNLYGKRGAEQPAALYFVLDLFARLLDFEALG